MITAARGPRRARHTQWYVKDWLENWLRTLIQRMLFSLLWLWPPQGWADTPADASGDRLVLLLACVATMRYLKTAQGRL